MKKVVVVSALSPVPNPPRIWTSVKEIQVVSVEEELRGRYKVTLRNSSTEAIQGLAFRNSGGMSIGLTDEARLVSAGGTFTRRTSCADGQPCELHLTSALTVHGTCTGGVEPCRWLMAQWRGRQIAAALVLPLLEEAKRKEAIDVSELVKAIRAVNITGSLTTAAAEIMRSTRARATSRSEMERYLLRGANGLVSSFEERLIQPGIPGPPGTRNQDVLAHSLEDLIDKCRQIVSSPPPLGKDRFRL